MNTNIDLTRTRHGSFFVILETILSVIIVYATIFSQSSIVSLAFSCSFIILLIFFIQHFVNLNFNRLDMCSAFLIFIIVASLFNVIFTTVDSGASISFEYLQSFFLFVATLISFNMSLEYGVTKNTETVFFISQAVIAVAYPFCQRFVPQTVHHDVGSSFNFSNPNLAAMFILPTIFYMILGAIRYKNKLIKAGFILLAIVDIVMMLDTGARNTLISITYFFILIVWAMFTKKASYPKAILFLTASAPIIFVPIYLNAIEIIMETGWLDFLVSKGKQLDSRVKVWTDLFDRLSGHWILGDYAHIRGNMHNSHLVVLGSFGIIVLALTIAFLYFVLKKANLHITSFYERCCLSAFMATLFIGISEGAIFSGGQGLHILCSSFLLFINLTNRRNTRE